MSLLDKLFPKQKERQEGTETFKLLNGYQPVFTTWGGCIYESELVRSAIDARARHASKLSLEITGNSQMTLQRRLQKAPNGFQSWSQFLYRLSTILDVKNTAFIVPVIDRYGQMTGLFPICPHRWELVDVNGTPWIRFFYDNNQTSAIELARVGILTKFQYRNDLFGEPNTALDDTMDLIEIQRQAIEESAKNSATYRLMAKVSNFTKPEDLAKERKRFDEENFKNGGGGLLLLPNTYTDIKQVTQQTYTVNSSQLALIQQNVYNYFGVNEDILQNKAYGDAWAAFYEGAIEPFSIQLSDVMTNMVFSQREQGFKSRIYFTANRLQYMTNSDKMNVSSQLVDRGILSINEAREIWNMEPVDGGDVHIVRGEYYNANEKVISTDDEPEEESEDAD